ncbi:MAG: hypothetical protein GY810_01290 [Aureispira sp.]|nr:hypothetical protein [Aureispira sp.]
MVLDNREDEEILKAKKSKKLDLIEFIFVIIIFASLIAILFSASLNPMVADLPLIVYLPVIGSSLVATPLLMSIFKFKTYRKGYKPRGIAVWTRLAITVSVLFAVVLVLAFSAELLLGYREVFPIEIAGFIFLLLGCIAFVGYFIYILKTIKQDLRDKD